MLLKKIFQKVRVNNMLAEEMRRISEQNLNTNEKFNEIYNKLLESIKEASKNGKSRTTFGCYGYYEFRDQLISKLENDGFRVVRGYEIDAGYHNQMTTYIIW